MSAYEEFGQAKKKKENFGNSSSITLHIFIYV